MISVSEGVVVSCVTFLFFVLLDNVWNAGTVRRGNVVKDTRRQTSN